MSDAGLISAFILGILLLIAICVGGAFGCSAYNRYQARANANNKVKVSAIEIRNQAQRVKIAKQQADIRYQNSVGIRRAQDEIARTLTPLYVQFELTQALQNIATSGKNNSIIYIPTDPHNGLPVVPTSNTNPEQRPGTSP